MVSHGFFKPFESRLEEEVVNFICVHDNETLYDSTVWKMPLESTSVEERLRANWLCTAAGPVGKLDCLM